MSSVSHLKGVRTKYRNILEKGIEDATLLLQSDIENTDIEIDLTQTSKCLECLKLCSEKLENQSEKLAAAVDSSDSEYVKVITEADSILCADAIERLIDLKQHKEKLSIQKKKQESESEHHVPQFEEVSSNPLVALQKDMQKLMELQLKQQEKILEFQGHKKNVSSVKLPKLEMASFNGDKTKLIEFWDSFKHSVHENKGLSNSEKFNYLKSKVYGEAKSAISGLVLSDDNYQVAIDILHERFGNIQEAIDLHYSRLINLNQAENKTSSLRTLLDNVKKHLRSLEVLGQNIDQDVFVSMLRAKLPGDVLLQLEMKNGAYKKWSTLKLCDALKEYIMARERAENQTDVKDRKHSNPQNSKSWKKPDLSQRSTSGNAAGSAHALTAMKRQPKTKPQTRSENYADKCRYCQQKHWSDECSKYRTISERKEQLKGSCYRCLKVGHISNDCLRDTTCVYCSQKNVHHRSLCPDKFEVKEAMTHLANEIYNDTGAAEENMLVSSSEMVLMQTALTEIRNPETTKNQPVRLLLDSGSHRTYITETLAQKLCLQATGEQQIKLVTFGSNTSQIIRTKTANVDVKLKNGEFTSITVNIVPTISGELHRRPVKTLETEQIKHIIGSVNLADTLPTNNESSTIEMLIGNDYYLDFILSQTIEIQPGLFLLGSKFGWILTGRTSDHDSLNGESCMLIMSHGNSITNTSLTSNVDSLYQQSQT